MKILKCLSGMFFTMAVMAMFGCGGGGGSTPPPPTKAKLTLLSQGTAGTKIRGIEVTVELQSGVTVKATPSTINPAQLETDAGVVVLSGATVADPTTTKLLSAVYTPATPTAAGTVKILLSVQPDFNLGEYVTVNADIAAGTVPVATGFKLSGFIAADLNGVAIPGVTSSFVPAFN